MSKGLWCITGDWQLDSNPSFDHKYPDGSSARFADSCAAVYNLLSYAKEAGASKLFFLGDATEHKLASNLERTALSQLFSKASDIFDEIYGLPGNHDGSLFSLSSSTLEPMGILLKNFYYFDKLASKQIGEKKIGIFLPYLHGVSEKEIDEMFKQEFAKHERPHGWEFFLFGHYGVSGVTSGAENMTLTKDMLALSTIRANEFKRGWMGHIHKAQQIQNISFPGSTYSHNFGERNDKKGFILYDPETGKETFVPLEPKHKLVQIKYQEAQDADVMINDGYLPDNCIVKVAGILTPTETKEYLENNPQRIIEEVLIEKGAKSVFWELEFKREERSKRSEINITQPFLEMAETYFKENASEWETKEELEAIEVLAKELLDSQEGYKSKYGYIKLDSIHYENFLSIVDETLDLSEGIRIISAPNGTGKSNFLGGLYFAFVGKTMTGVNLSSLVNKKASSASVEVSFYSGEDNYVIKRVVTRKTGGGATQKVYLTKNGIDIKDGGNAAAQDQTTSLIGFDAKAFSNTIFFIQDDIDSIITISGNERKEIIGSIFKTNVLKGASDLAGKMLATANKILNDLIVRKQTLEGIKFDKTVPEMHKELSEITELIKKYELALENGEKLVKDADTMLSLLQEQRLKASSKLAKNSDISARPENLKSTWAKRKGQLEGLLVVLRMKRDNTKADIEAKGKEIPERQKEIEQIVQAREIMAENCRTYLSNADKLLETKEKSLDGQAKWLQKSLEAKEKIKELSTLNGITICPTCKQDTKHLEEHNKKLREEWEKVEQRAFRELAEIERVKQKISEEFSAENVKINFARTRVAEYDNETVKLKEKIKWLGETIISSQKDFDAIVKDGKDTAAVLKSEEAEHVTSLEKAIAEAKAASDEFNIASKEMASLNVKITFVQAEKGNLNAEINNVRNSQRTAQTREAVLKSNLDRVQNLEKDLAAISKDTFKEQKSARRLELLKKVFGPTGIQALVLDSIRPDLEGRINHYLLQLGVTKFRIFIQTQTESETTDNVKESFEFMIDDGIEPFLDIRSYSGGEKQAIKIAIHLALSDIAFERSGIRFPFFALDEIYDGLSTNIQKALTQLIFTLNADLILVICHIKEVANEFDSIIELSYSPEEGTKLHAKRKELSVS